MVKITGIRFKRAGKIYYFDPADMQLAVGNKAIVETVRGVEVGDVVIASKMVDDSSVVQPLKKIMRIATEEDLKHTEENKAREPKAIELCHEKIRVHNLPMKLVGAEYTFDNSKIIFYFTAEGRVDFRELVKDLASVFKMRIELRQIGVRDEAKLVGGLGPCGLPMCCTTWLGDFDPVSIKMAKEQNLSLNPAKISGICGRLMCCLKYESGMYEDSAARHVPRTAVPVIVAQEEDPSCQKAAQCPSCHADAECIGCKELGQKGEAALEDEEGILVAELNDVPLDEERNIQGGAESADAAGSSKVAVNATTQKATPNDAVKEKPANNNLLVGEKQVSQSNSPSLSTVTGMGAPQNKNRDFHDRHRHGQADKAPWRENKAGTQHAVAFIDGGVGRIQSSIPGKPGFVQNHRGNDESKKPEWQECQSREKSDKPVAEGVAAAQGANPDKSTASGVNNGPNFRNRRRRHGQIRQDGPGDPDGSPKGE